MTNTARPGRELAASWPYALVIAAALVVVDLILRRLGAPRGARRARSAAAVPARPRMDLAA